MRLFGIEGDRPLQQRDRVIGMVAVERGLSGLDQFAGASGCGRSGNIVRRILNADRLRFVGFHGAGEREQIVAAAGRKFGCLESQRAIRSHVARAGVVAGSVFRVAAFHVQSDRRLRDVVRRKR